MAPTRHEEGIEPTIRGKASVNGRALDGQDVVDERHDPAGAQAEIKRRSAQQDAVAAEQRAATPSVRFWDTPSARAGALFALVAGLLTLATRIWPVAPPQSHGSPGMFWTLASVAVAVAYLGAFFLADRYWKTARIVLIGAAVVHVLIGLMSGAAVDAQAEGAGAGAILFDAAPALLAIVGAFLLAPAAQSPSTLASGREI